MAEIRTIGLSKIEISDVAVDGGVGTTFAALGVTYKDTAEITQEDAAITEHMCEESDDPQESIAIKGKTTVKWSIIDCTPATLVKVLGGTATGTAPNEIWSAPAAAVNIEKSIKITPSAGKVITIVRAKIQARINMKLARTGIFLVDITATVLTPTKAATASMTIGS
jgi:hypothetical protein